MAVKGIHNPHMQTIEVADFFEPYDRPGDVVPAIRRALRQATRGNAMIRIPEGEHHLYPEAAWEGFRYISNHDPAVRQAGIPITGKRDLVIDGNGARFICHGRIIPIFVEDSERVTVTNCSFDWDIPFDGEGEVVAVDDGMVELKVRDVPHWSVRNGVFLLEGEGWHATLDQLFAFDAEQRMPAVGSGDNLGGGWHTQWHATDLGNSRVRFSGNFKRHPRIGDRIVLRVEQRLNPGVVMSCSSQVAMIGVSIHAAGGMGFIAQRCDGVTLHQCSVVPAQGRISSASFDASHFVNCRGEVVMEQCRFENQLDDGCNCHGSWFPVVRRLDAHTLRVRLAHHQQRGAPVGGTGDSFELVSRDDMRGYWSGRASVVAVRNGGTADVTFIEALPDDVSDTDLLDNISWQPDLTIRGCTMRGNRARAILLKTLGRTIIEDNDFRVPGAAILGGIGCGQYHESRALGPCLIRGNRFDRCAYIKSGWGPAVIRISAQKSSPDFQLHGAMRILDNVFTTYDDDVLDVTSLARLELKGNRVQRVDGQAIGDWYTCTDCGPVEVADNQLDEATATS